VLLISFLAFFLLASFFGWIIDSLYRSIADRKWVNAGFLVGPICPIYGFGALLLLLLVQTFTGEPLIIRALIYFLALSAVEFIGGLFCTHILKVRLWDYSDALFNIMGHVDILHSLYWVLLAFTFESSIWPIIHWVDTEFSLLAEWLSYFIFIAGILVLIGAVMRKFIRQRSRIPPLPIRHSSHELQAYLKKLEGEYESMLIKVDERIIIPSERPVRGWFDEREHYLEDLHDKATKLYLNLSRIRHLIVISNIEAGLKQFLIQLEHQRRTLKKIRSSMEGKRAVMRDGSSILSFMKKMNGFRDDSKKKLREMKYLIRWNLFIRKRKWSPDLKRILERFPSWYNKWYRKRSK